jgi:hypothetical protein
MNSFGSEMIRQQRLNTVKRLGNATDLDFQDKKIEVQATQNQMMKDKRR